MSSSDSQDRDNNIVVLPQRMIKNPPFPLMGTIIAFRFHIIEHCFPERKRNTFRSDRLSKLLNASRACNSFAAIYSAFLPVGNNGMDQMVPLGIHKADD